MFVCGGAGKSLARPTSRCSRTESVVSLERGVCLYQVFFLARQGTKEIHTLLTETLEEHAPSYATIKNWVTQFKHGSFSTCDARRPGQTKIVTTRDYY